MLGCGLPIHIKAILKPYLIWFDWATMWNNIFNDTAQNNLNISDDSDNCDKW